MKKILLGLTMLSLSLAGCSGTPVEKVEKYLANNEFEDAKEWLNDELEDAPKNALYHTLMVETILAECAHTNCFDNSPDDLKPLENHFVAIGEGIYEEEGESIDLIARINKLANNLANSKHHPKALATMNVMAPYGAVLQNLTLITFNKVADHIQNGDIPPASTLLGSLASKITLKSPNQALAQLLNGYIINDTDMINESIENFQKAEKDIALNEAGIETLPYAIYQRMVEMDANNGTENFIKELRNTLRSANIPYLQTERGQAEIANAIYAMTRNTSFIERALNHSEDAQKTILKTKSKMEKAKEINAASTISNEGINAEEISATAPVIEAVSNIEVVETNNKPTTIEENKTATPNKAYLQKAKQELVLKITKVALLTNPQSVNAWNTFLNPARDYAIETGTVSILYEGLGPKDIPSNIIEPYNNALFSVIESQIVKNVSILDAVQHIILPADGGDKVKDRVTTLLNEAMIKAVNEANYDLVYEYASFQPDIARLSRQKVVSITIEALENKWANNKFDGMDRLAEFLSNTMGIDFSLDSLLLQSYDDFLSKTGVQQKLNADNSDDLLKPTNEVQVDLGDKFKYLQEHFKNKPEIIDNMLKNLIVKATGEYSVPVALHKLYNYFGDSFPETDRHAYLISAIKNSLQKDTKLSAIDFAKRGLELQKIYSEIPESFIIAETMKRLKTLDDSKALWSQSSPELKQALKDTQPQFTALMSAVEAYEAGDHEHAAKLFTILSDKTLIEQARPYLREYITTIQSQVGIYQFMANNKRDGMNTELVYIDLIDDEQNVSDTSETEVKSQTDLLAVKVTLVSALGEIYVQSPQTLTEDYGKVARYVLTGRINPNTMEINIPENQKSGVNLPLPFEKIFGNLTKLNLEGDRIIYFTNDKSYTFNRIETIAEGQDSFEDGKFTMTENHEENDARSYHILPVGSILEFATNKRRPIEHEENGEKTTLYPITGTILHPASPNPRDITGFYAPSKHLISLTYTYPLKDGGILEAMLKCQVMGNSITCAGHNKNWGRQLYKHVVFGQRIEAKDKPKQTVKNR